MPQKWDINCGHLSYSYSCQKDDGFTLITLLSKVKLKTSKTYGTMKDLSPDNSSEHSEKTNYGSEAPFVHSVHIGGVLDVFCDEILLKFLHSQDK